MRRKARAQVSRASRFAAACLSLTLAAQYAVSSSAHVFDEVNASSNQTAARQKAESFDVPALLSEVALKEKAMTARRLEYTWTARLTDRELGRRGEVRKESSSVYEVYPVRGEFARKLLARDGVPVSRERADRELKKTAERLEKAAREDRKRAEAGQTPTPQPQTPAQLQNPAGLPSFGFSTGHRESNGFSSTEISLAVWRFFRYCEFGNARRETFDGREAIVLDFRPRADFRPADEIQRPYARLRGRVWIDAADRTVARLEAWADDAPTSPDMPEPSVVFEHARVAEGVWLERLVRIKTYGRKEIFNGIELDFTKEITDFKRFSSVAGDDRVDEPTEKPR
jgi:hypothetical protein